MPQKNRLKKINPLYKLENETKQKSNFNVRKSEKQVYSGNDITQRGIIPSDFKIQ